MELRVLKYFLMIAREENITRAAQRLNVTQPTLSRQLMQMEEELGVKLFKRRKHSISLTEDGILLKQRAQEIINIEEKIREDLSHSDDMLMGTITIGSGETCVLSGVAKLAASFRKENPKVMFEVCSGIADDIKDKIERLFTGTDASVPSFLCKIKKVYFCLSSDPDLCVILTKSMSYGRINRYINCFLSERRGNQ